IKPKLAILKTIVFHHSVHGSLTIWKCDIYTKRRVSSMQTLMLAVIITFVVVVTVLLIGAGHVLVRESHYVTTPQTLPRVIWTFWTQGWDRAPDICKLCRKSWEMMNPE